MSREKGEREEREEEIEGEGARGRGERGRGRVREPEKAGMLLTTPGAANEGDGLSAPSGHGAPIASRRQAESFTTMRLVGGGGVEARRDQNDG